MHMADALLSAPVGLAGWAGAGLLLGVAARRVGRPAEAPADGEGISPAAMGVLGAFVFAAQMVNFTIPGTGSSGHLGGGLLLAIVLGPWAAFLVMASILAVQALLFADGGLLAWGCNLLNLGLFPCFVALPLVWRPLAGRGWRRLGAVAAALVGLLLGALGVAVETRLSGIATLPFGPFVATILPIHAAIGLVEGVATLALVEFVARVEPGVLAGGRLRGGGRLVPVVGVAALLVAGVLSWFASSRPDGLEWSVERVAAAEGAGEAVSTGALHGILEEIQQGVAPLPDYGFPTLEAQAGEPAWPAADAGTSTAGLVGGLATLAVVGLLAGTLRLGRSRRSLAHQGVRAST